MKSHKSQLTFKPLLYDAELFFHFLLQYQGLPATENVTIPRTEGRNGSANCFGLLLLTAQDMGLWVGDPNLPPSDYDGQSVAATIAEILKYNFHRVYERKPGDLLLMRYRSQHVGVLVNLANKDNPASYFHISQQAKKAQFDYIDAGTENRIQTVYRLNNIVH